MTLVFNPVPKVVKPGFLSDHLLSGHLVGQKSRKDYEPCRTRLMTSVLDGFSSTSINTIIKTGQKQDMEMGINKINIFPPILDLSC